MSNSATAPASAGLPREIRASVHQDAIHRVTRFFDATVGDCLNEVFQNARRAGATQVSVTVKDGLVTVTDDGRGIDDPQDVLAFGMSRWEDRVAASEDPAGMGIYALSRMEQVSITSRQADGPGWSVQLEERHFSGEEAARVTPSCDDRLAAGTTVTFAPRPATPQARDSALQEAVEKAAKYYPLPVTLNGHSADRKDFLEGCVHVEEWQGLRIGVSHRHLSFRDPAINFHGVTVSDDGNSDINARINGRDQHWQTRIDVVDCPELELTLPARKQIVKTEFVARLAARCRQAVFNAMAQADPPAQVSFTLQQEAARLGIQIPDAEPTLQRWEPEVADSERSRSYAATRNRHPVGKTALRVEWDAPACDEQALARAINDSALELRLFHGEHGMAGYPWYNAMTTVEEITIRVHDADGTVRQLTEERRARKSPFTERPVRIVYRLRTADAQGKEDHIEVDADVAFFEDEPGWTAGDTPPLVTRDSDILPDELVELMTDSFFYFSEDSDCDSRDTQECDFKRNAENTARKTLMSTREALEATLQNAVREYVYHHLPRDYSAVIYMEHGRGIDVEISEA